MGTLIVSIQYKIPYWNTSDHALLRSSRMRAGLLFSHEGHMPPATICNISSQRLVGYCWVRGREMNKLHFQLKLVHYGHDFRDCCQVLGRFGPMLLLQLYVSKPDNLLNV